MAEPASQPDPVPAPPRLGVLFEQSLRALVNAPAVFKAAAERPAPAWTTSAGLAVGCGAVAGAIHVVYTAIADGGHSSGRPLLWWGAFISGELIVYLSLYLLSAVVLYVLGRGFGQKRGFSRAFQGAAALSLVYPVRAVCSGLPVLWAAPTALTAWVATGAIEGLFSAPPWPARAFCAVLAAATIGVKAFIRALPDNMPYNMASLKEAAQIATTDVELERRIQALRASAPEAGRPAVSGLDLLRAPADEALPSSPPAPGQAPSPQQAQALQQNALAMLDALGPMLSNPAFTQRMGPQQKADLRELQSMIQEFRGQMTSGKRPSREEQALRMQRIQSLTLRLLTAAAQPSRSPSPDGR